jgi:hypothetical protein
MSQHPSRDVAAAIWKERLRQIKGEGYGHEHDDVHDRGELALAAASYAIEAVRIAQINPPHHLARLAHECWPFAQSANWPKPQRRLLVIAAALLVAEIERLDRRLGGEALL